MRASGPRRVADSRTAPCELIRCQRCCVRPFKPSHPSTLKPSTLQTAVNDMFWPEPFDLEAAEAACKDTWYVARGRCIHMDVHAVIRGFRSIGPVKHSDLRLAWGLQSRPLPCPARSPAPPASALAHEPSRTARCRFPHSGASPRARCGPRRRHAARGKHTAHQDTAIRCSGAPAACARVATP